jgi:hypothetical protein
MTLALQVSVGALAIYLLILFIRWCRVREPSEHAAQQAAFAAVALSGACIGGGYPLVWAMSRNIGAYVERGSTAFTFTGNLPPGVDEDDLLIVLTVGILVLIGQAVAAGWRACQ